MKSKKPPVTTANTTARQGDFLHRAGRQVSPVDTWQRRDIGHGSGHHRPFVPTDDPIEGLSHLRPLRDIPEMQPLFEVTGDPLSRRYVPDSLVDLVNTITFSEIQPPPPTTPEQGPKKKPVTPT